MGGAVVAAKFNLSAMRELRTASVRRTLGSVCNWHSTKAQRGSFARNLKRELEMGEYALNAALKRAVDDHAATRRIREATGGEHSSA
jgi:hypothetical protein